MPRDLPRYVEHWRDRHGKMRFYFRRGKGKRIALPDDVTSEEFATAYAAALAGKMPETRGPVREPVKPGSISALIENYMRSSSYRTLRATTRKGYSNRLETLRTKHGHRTLSGLNRARIVSGVLAPYADKPGAALAMLKMLRVLVRHGLELGWLREDPTIGIKRPKGNEIHTWTDGEIAAFEERWPIGTKQRLAFSLMLCTGQRRSDVHRMTWRDISDAGISVVQQKTGQRLVLPLLPELCAVLETAERAHVTIINTEFGKPFTVDGFSRFMRDAISAAGLPLECQPHGLRKAAGRKLAEAGCTANEIMSVLGHKTLAEAERYTRGAQQAHLAKAAMGKLDRQKANKTPQTTPAKFGEMVNKGN